ncbi:MAG: glutamate synthase subunit beta [Nitrospinota bacterium]|nr:glutamate synthase subunit beta [Nitrospinota bacterium]
MGALKGFMEIGRELPPERPIPERLNDYRECYDHMSEQKFQDQGARCMDCGIPFCQSNSGCPLGNLIPDWNDMVYRGQWESALVLMTETNNFPEFTGRICPAPCEGACVLGINEPPVTIRRIEQVIADKGFEEGWIKPRPPQSRTGKTVAIVGSGPAGLAAAAQLNSAGHTVTVFEKADRIGGLLMYGIPNFKMEKEAVKRRIRIMEEEGIIFKTGVNVGVDVPAKNLQEEYDVLLLCGGAEKPRDLPVEGRDLDGIHFAMDFLTQQNKRMEGDIIPSEVSITAEGKKVLIIGGGDTGSDCLGTSLRQGATEVHQFELLPQPPEQRAENNPWPQWPVIQRSTSSHDEALKPITEYSVMTKRLSGENGKLKKIHAVRLDWGEPDPATRRRPMNEIPGSEFEMEIDLVLLAMGFLHPVHQGMVKELGVELDKRGNVASDKNKMTSVPGVFVAGDMTRGQSLVVWAIAEGREAARGIDHHLMGATTLPASEFL